MASLEFDLSRADVAIRDAADRLRLRLPSQYPTDPTAAYREQQEAEAAVRSLAIVTRVHGTAVKVLQAAVEQERDARHAQEAAVVALRSLGDTSASWAQIGALLGVSAQAAHKRFRAVAEPEEDGSNASAVPRRLRPAAGALVQFPSRHARAMSG